MNRKTGTKLYIDQGGVVRGYYVYLHKGRTTGVVFYVGKGSGQRAWESIGRNELWKGRVATLDNGWEVEIIKNDLSEIEAFVLEAELVEKHGGCAADGGTLTNWVPGGEHPVSVSFSVELPDDFGWEELYCNLRIFSEFSRTEKVALIKKMKQCLEEIELSLQQLEQEAEVLGDEMLSDNVVGLSGSIENLQDAVSDFLRQRISWKDLALTIEEVWDEVDLLLEDDGSKYYQKIGPLVEKTYMILSDIICTIDSGNRKEAEETATMMTTIPAAEQGDPRAQSILGYRYTLGQGVPQDDVQAYKWYSIAAAQGQFGLLFDILKKRMTQPQIAEAERLSQEWLDKQ